MPATRLLSAMVATWNNAATSFTGLKLNVTDTASAAGSLLMDLQVGGASKFTLSKAGYGFFQSSLETGANLNVSTNSGLIRLGASSDVILARDAANTLALRNGTAAQSFNVYNTYTDASNYERGYARWSANVFSIGTEALGTGVARQTWLYGGGGAALIVTGSSVNFYQTPVAASNNSIDLGTSANRWRNGYFGTSVNLSGNGALSAPAFTGTGAWITGGSTTTTKPYALIEPTGTTSTGWSTAGTGLGINAATGFAGNLLDLQTASASAFKVDSSGNAIFGSGGNVILSNGGKVYLGAGLDLVLGRAAAATLQHGAADAASPVAQTIKFQDVATGTSNTAGVNATIQAPAGTGTGAGGSLIFQVAPAGSSGSAKNAWATAWLMNSSGHLLAGTDATYDIGANATNRPRSIYAATKVFAGNGVETNGALNGFNFTSRGYILAPADGVFKLSNNADNDFSRLQLGGTTSSFPALKRSTTALQARLADDSAFTAIQGKLTTDTAYTAGDPTTTGYLVVYDSTGTAYRVPALLN